MSIFYTFLAIYLASGLFFELVLRWQVKNVENFSKYFYSNPVRPFIYQVICWIPGLNTYFSVKVIINFFKNGLNTKRFIAFLEDSWRN